jgi:hypothetical protein
MKTRIQDSNLVAVVSLIVIVFAIGRLVFAADQKQARVTEVVHDVRLLAAQAAARPAVINDTVHEGTAVRTGADSRAELTFSDLTLTRLGANTVFSVGAGGRTYDLGSGAILMTAPPQAGTIKINTAVATCAVSGFTAIVERHSEAWNKIIVVHGEGTLSIKGVPGDPCRMHTGQMVVFPPRPTYCPQVLNIDLSKLLNGRLVAGFKRKLPEMHHILKDIKDQQSEAPKGGLVDPTNQDSISQALSAQPTPPPFHTPPPTPPPHTPPPHTPPPPARQF